MFVQARIIDGQGSSVPIADSNRIPAVSAGQIVWHHFDVNDHDARHWLDRQNDIGDIIKDALTETETRPRGFGFDSGLFVVLRGVNTNEGDDPEDMVAIRVWLEPGRIISSRRRRLLAMQDIANELDAGKGPCTTGGFLVTMVEKLADRIGAFVDGIEDRLGDAEEQVSAENAHEFRARLGLLRRQMATVRRFMAPQRDALDRLYRQPIPWMTDHDSNRLREESDRFTRYLEDLDLARERAVVLQEEFLSQIAQQQNSRMYVISIISAIFLPLTFVTGLLGMNVGGLPGIESSLGFGIALVTMLSASAGSLIYLRWKRWI